MTELTKKIRERQRRGYSREAGGYTAWNEIQVVQGRKVIGRYDLISQAMQEHPDAWVPPTLLPKGLKK